MVGLDTLVHVADNCYKALENDPEREVFKIPDYVRGCSRRSCSVTRPPKAFLQEDQGRIETCDLYTGEYCAKGGNADIKSAQEHQPGRRSGEAREEAVRGRRPAGQFAWKVNSRALIYAARMTGRSATASPPSMMRCAGATTGARPVRGLDAMGFDAVLPVWRKTASTSPRA
ncbi:MAG: hypothetical protein R3B07_13945 [Polyangiaceae bacterium]